MKIQTFLLSRNLLIFCLHSAQNLLIYDILIQIERRERILMTPHYRITEKILNLVQEISEKSTQLSFEKRELHLRKENRIRSIQSSLAIENNSLTIEQVTDIIEGKRVLGPQKDIHEVQNAYEAYEQVFKMDPYEINDFLLAHHLLMQGLVKLPGKFRLGDVGIYDSNGRVMHIGARAQFVGSLVQELFDWGKNSMISPIVKSCIIHFELEIIHPFEDGNGRMGRLWQSLILSKWNSLFEWLPIESVIYNHQQGYYDALSKSNRENDATYFIEFMLQAILQTLESYGETASVVEDFAIHLTVKEKEYYRVLETYLKAHQSVSAYQAQELLGMSGASVRRYLKKYVEIGLLKKTGTTKNRLYYLV